MARAGADALALQKAGLVTTDLVPLAEAPHPLFDNFDREKSGALMAAMEA